MISKKVQAINKSATLAINAKANSLRAAGEDVLNFSAGEPDFEVSEHIRDAAHQAITENFSYYTATEGIFELQHAITDKIMRENNVHASAENVIATDGGKEALFLLFQTIISRGDEVIVPAPFWVSYLELIKFAGGKAVILPTDKQFHITAADIAEAITDKTKAILLNSPSNPTGAVISPEELKKIARLAADKDLLIISDEVYEHFIYDGEHLSIASIPEMFDRAITINSLSKTYCMTGWRIGYAVGPKDIIAGMVKLKSHISSNASSIVQKAAAAALSGPQDKVAEMRDAFKVRRDLLWEGVNSLDGITLEKPEGAFYGFIDFSELMEAKGIKDSFDLCAQVLEQAKVALVPGQAFGNDYETYARFSFATSEDKITEGLNRLQSFAK